MSMELTTQIDPSIVPAFLELQREASIPYDKFVYADEAEARKVRRILFDAGAGELAPPHGRAAIKDGELVGMLAGALAEDLERLRLDASLVLGRAGVLDDKDLMRRMWLAVQTLAHPEAGDYYYGVVAVTPAARGTEVGAELFELARQEARNSGARRVVGQTLADNLRLIAHYEATGHHWIGEGKTSDPKTGRELHYRHFAIEL
jgi:GNAT superfamily N-acetyltransferase